MNHLQQEITIGEATYVVAAVDAQTQYKILQKLSRYGAAHLVAGMVRAESQKDHEQGVKSAFMQAILAVVQNMPESDQDFCITEALKNTVVKDSAGDEQGKPLRVGISMFSGRIAEYVLLGARAIGVQLGDFSCFLNLIPSSTAKAQEDSE